MHASMQASLVQQHKRRQGSLEHWKLTPHAYSWHMHVHAHLQARLHTNSNTQTGMQPGEASSSKVKAGRVKGEGRSSTQGVRENEDGDKRGEAEAAPRSVLPRPALDWQRWVCLLQCEERVL